MLYRRSPAEIRAARWRAATTVALALANVIVYARHPAKILLFYRHLRHWPNVCRPRTKNEKFLWRKIFDRNPIYRLITDKLTVRPFVAARCPELRMSEIVWTGRSSEQIPDALVQPGFVIKTNNGCDRNIIIAGPPPDRALINRRIGQWLARRYGVMQGEWVYGQIEPHVMVERLIAKPKDPDFVDICCHVVMGRCVFGTVDKDVKQEHERIAIYDRAGNRISVRCKRHARSEVCAELPADYPAPATWAEAVRCAERIAKDFDHIRVDFMSAGTQLYFGECTVFPMGGHSLMIGGDEQISAAWDLRNSWFMRTPQGGLCGVYQRLYRIGLDE